MVSRAKLTDLCFSPQVKRLLSSSERGNVGIWDLDIQREEVIRGYLTIEGISHVIHMPLTLGHKNVILWFLLEGLITNSGFGVKVEIIGERERANLVVKP